MEVVEFVKFWQMTLAEACRTAVWCIAFCSALFGYGITATQAAKLEIVVPAYFYPSGGSPWIKLNAAASKVPITAIMNPGNGPGNSVDSNYVSAVNSLRAAGGHVIGYVYSSYGARAQQQVIADIDKYDTWYNIEGIFVDEMANTGPASRLDYYRNIYNHVKSIDPNWSVMGNPGTTTIESYLTWPTTDRLMVFENVGTAYPSYTPSSWNFNYDASRFVHLVHTEPSSAQMLTDLSLAMQKHAGSIYITDDVLANPWDTVPTYWNAMVDAVANINADYNSDGVVNMADYVVWSESSGQTGAGLAADGNGDHVVDAADYAYWKQHFGATAIVAGSGSAIVAGVPEPAGAVLLAIAAIALPARRCRSRV